MCGITGFVGEGTRDDLERMTRAISYRGPDGEGFLFDAHAKVGLGHRRLSVIDLSGGGQPLYNEDRSVAVIFNGEIYNFKALRKSLLPRHTFTTKSDTEVIAHLYEERGEQVFVELSGMFAIAIYDVKRQRVILARDRLGKKPLYWGVFGGTLLFGSELKALMQHPLFQGEIDLESLQAYLANDYVPTPRSIWKHIHKLPPASYLIWKDARVIEGVFWRPRFVESKMSFSDATGELGRRLEKSVQKRLVSDVPLGVFLSGGIDSTTVAYFAQKNSPHPVETFSIAFEEKSFDESSYASATAKFLGTKHHEQVFTTKHLLNLIPQVFELLDEPVADPSILPTYLLSSFTKKSVTVALSGDGADELFAGYPTFQADRFAGFFAAMPAFVRKAIASGVEWLPVDERNFSLEFKARKFLEGFEVPARYRHARWLGSFGRDEQSHLFAKDVWAALTHAHPYVAVDWYLAEAKTASARNALLYAYLRTYLMDEVLVKVDRASMWNALEVRAPFLDEALVDFALSLPYDFKCRGRTTKYILKELMKGKIPPRNVRRPKKGFGIPVAKWLRQELKNLCLEILSESEIKKDGLFDPRYVDKLLHEHLSGTRDHRKPLWSLLVFQLWQQKWGR